jgi:hypothetical protein
MDELKSSQPVIMEPVIEVMVSSLNENSRTIINDILGQRRSNFNNFTILEEELFKLRINKEDLEILIIKELKFME